VEDLARSGARRSRDAGVMLRVDHLSVRYTDARR
jgi:hypothetical protein